MTLRLEHLIKPFSVMSEEEQLALIAKVRHNRFTVRQTKVKTHIAKQQKKAKVKSSNKTKELLMALSPEDRKKLLLKLQQSIV